MLLHWFVKNVIHFILHKYLRKASRAWLVEVILSFSQRINAYVLVQKYEF